MTISRKKYEGTKITFKSIADLRKEMNISHSEPAPEEEGAENNEEKIAEYEDKDEDEDEEEDEEEDEKEEPETSLQLIKSSIESKLNNNGKDNKQV